MESSGENALELARALKSASEESGITMVAAPQAADIYRIQDQISLPIFAQHIDPITPGGHTGSNLIETLIEAGISGSLINHSENRMKLADIDEVIQLCKQNDIESCVCTNNIATSKAIATFSPDAVAVEPPELIGTGIPVSQAQPEVVEDSVKGVKSINKKIKVLCGAGIFLISSSGNSFGFSFFFLIFFASGCIPSKSERFRNCTPGIFIIFPKSRGLLLIASKLLCIQSGHTVI